MAIFKPERIYKLMREKNFPCYVIADGKNIIDEQHNEKLSVNEACTRLEEALSEVSGNDVSIEIAPQVAANGKLGGKGKMFFERVDLSGSVKPSNAIAGLNDSAMLKSLFEKNIELEKQLIQAAAQKKIDELTARMEQLENGESGGINGIFNNLMQNEAIQQVVAGWLMNATGMAPPTAALNGVPSDIEHCIERISKVDLNFSQNLCKLADLAETNPNKYFLAVSML